VYSRKKNILDIIHYYIWGKSERVAQADEELKFKPLLLHMLDASAVANIIWDSCIHQRIKGSLERKLGPHARSLFIFVAGAHDIGKASPYFQKRLAEFECKLEGFGLRFSEYDEANPHGFISAREINAYLDCKVDVLSRLSGGHHGIFPRSENISNLGRDSLGNKKWEGVRRDLLDEMSRVIGIHTSDIVRFDACDVDPAIIPLLAGLITIVDWIASNEKFFPVDFKFEPFTHLRLDSYWENAKERAVSALEKIGWYPPLEFTDEAAFGRVFIGEIKPNKLQEQVTEVARSFHCPYLMIIEAPTGSGKTEAALYAADLAMCRGFARGMYIAMPTQATSNAMFVRVHDGYLKNRGFKGRLNTQLVHGNAMLALSSDEKDIKEGEINVFKPSGIESGDNNETDIDAQSWFTARKRPLLAPFGIGTIDQSLLSVIQTKHWFVRLHGLSGKVVIFDEVHAYDTYMSTILERLLQWLAQVDCTVILLSATLPEEKRKSLLRAYSGRDDFNDVRYPRITIAAPSHYPSKQAESPPVCHEVPTEGSSNIYIDFCSSDLSDLVSRIEGFITEGGCAAVICNTVSRSIEVYKFLKDNLCISDELECFLLHARTLQRWRRKREEAVIRKFGRGERASDGKYHNPNRPKRAVLVSTQIVEQSLDLDFDVMFSEIAPIDLLLQRMGRLHRHERERPQTLRKPRFIILYDASPEGTPPERFEGGAEYIYERYILLRTLFALRERRTIEVPREVEALINAVYGPQNPASEVQWSQELERAKTQMDERIKETEIKAKGIVVGQPKDPRDLLEEFNMSLFDDEDPEKHEEVKAATREGRPAITTIMLPKKEIINRDPDAAETRFLLDHSVRLSNPALFRVLLENGERPVEWSRNADLRYARLVRYDDSGRCVIGDIELRLSEELGIEIVKRGA